MKIAALLSTKGGPGKTTVTASLGAFCADSGLRTLLIDLDNQPSLRLLASKAVHEPSKSQ